MERLLANILHRKNYEIVSARMCVCEREKDNRDNFSINNNDRLELYRSCYIYCAFFFLFSEPRTLTRQQISVLNIFYVQNTLIYECGLTTQAPTAEYYK